MKKWSWWSGIAAMVSNTKYRNNTTVPNFGQWGLAGGLGGKMLDASYLVRVLSGFLLLCGLAGSTIELDIPGILEDFVMSSLESN